METGRGSGGGGGGRGALVASKKMRKRKELDALVGAGGRRVSAKRRAVDQLLSESTEEDDYWIAGAKGAKGRGYRGNNSTRATASLPTCKPILRIWTALLLFASTLTTLTLIWLFIDIRQQTSFLRNQLDQVAAGSQGVPDALQKCHSWSRQLQANQTLLFAHLASLSRHLENITSQIGVVQSGLTHVEEKLTSSPELINVPQEVRDLSASVASFGSQIQDLQTSFNKIKEEQSSVLKLIYSIKSNVTNINVTLSKITKLYNSSGNNISEQSYAAEFESTINGLNMKIINLNDSISHKINYILDDQHKDHTSIEALEEMSANITSRLTTLHNDCSGVELLSSKANNISVLVSKHNKQLDEMQNQLINMVTKINSVENTSSKMIADFSELKSLVPTHRANNVKPSSNSSEYSGDKKSKLFGANRTQATSVGEG